MSKQVNRPTEDYALARIEINERLNRLQGVHYDMAILHLCGLPARVVGEMYAYSTAAVTKNTRSLQ